GPGVVIASVAKNVDSVVYQEIKTGFEGNYSPDLTRTGLVRGGSSLIYNPEFSSLREVTDRWADEAGVREQEYLLLHEKDEEETDHTPDE
ncbi:MAG: hypothetical protein LUQ07_04680, partial [Methanospirillum sp.]|nr:hypothetical protein [Methanospirillum sp.]